MIDLNKAPLSALVAEYNHLTGENVKRFADRKSAVKRLKEAQAKKADKKKSSQIKEGLTKREVLVLFIKEKPRTIDEICSQFEIKRNTVFNLLAYIASPKYCGKRLGSPMQVKRTEDKRVYI